MNPVITTAKAIILEDGMLLTIRKKDKAGNSRYYLPGGRQRRGETLVETLQRECAEELGAQVEPQCLALLWELKEGDFQMNECAFLCSLASRPDFSRVTAPDCGQDAWAWLYVDTLLEKGLAPGDLAQYIQAEGVARGPVYLGVLH